MSAASREELWQAVILSSSIGSRSASERTVEGFLVIGMDVTLRADGGEGMFNLDPFESRIALWAFNLDGYFESFAPDLAIGVSLMAVSFSNFSCAKILNENINIRLEH